MKVFVVGWPRSGTTWINSCLAQCLGLRPTEEFRTPDNAAIHAHRRVHEFKGDYPIVLTARDPRDSVVSHYYMGLRYVDGYSLTIRQYIEGPLMHGGRIHWGLPDCGWANYYIEWLDSNLNYIIALHEHVMADRIGEMTRLVEFCGRKPDTARIEKAVLDFTGRKRPAYNQQYRGKKSASAGSVSTPAGVSEWREHLSEEENELVLSHCGDVMERLGLGL